MSARQARRARKAKRRTGFYTDDDSDLVKFFSADADIEGVRATASAESFDRYLEARSGGREVRISVDGGRRSYRVGIVFAGVPDRRGYELATSLDPEPLILSPAEFTAVWPKSAWVLEGEHSGEDIA